ncbi:uncharacterized protein LOC112453202 [Temnothorax curvispinosus]|uniref:Uncharacterized protein LOC112453202 n=1 Tax=Temnothorax curvispinosus TaxID=300111 RepID=A0A6J1PJ07_9HYME|nr:uncharacterized protein LOC112453202 [Temnothorax curvispinosus]
MLETITERTNPVATVYEHEKDMQLSVQLNRWILQPIGVWPKLTEISHMERYAYGLINIICTSLIGFLFVPSAIFMALEMDNTYHILKLSGPLSFCLMAVVKYSSLIFRENDIRTGIKHIESDWMNTQHHGDRVIMIRSAKFGRRLVAICAFFMYGGAVFYYLALPFSKGKITESDGNLTYRPLVYPVARVIVDARHTPVAEILFWIQCLSGFIAHSITAGACSLAAVFAMHAYGRLEVLMQWIEHLVDGREDFCDNVDERLAMIVQQHVRILRFISLTDKVLREISVVEIVGCTLNMCFLGYYTLMEWESKETTSYITYIVLLISLTFNIFIFCYIGELVAEKCKKVGEVSYMIDWHLLSGKKGLALVLIIAMSNSSVKLTAGNLFELSLSTFGDLSHNPVSNHRAFTDSTMHETVTEKANPVAIVYDHKKNMQLSIQLNRWLLKPIGAWPKSTEISSIERYAYALVNIICTSLIGFLFVPSAIYLVLEMDDAYNILKLTGPLNFCLMAVVKYSSLIFRENDIRRGIEHIASDWTNTQHYGDRMIMIRNAKFGRRLVTICAFFMYGGFTFYYLALPFNNGKITEDDGNLTYRPLMYPVARVLIDARHSPVSEIFFWIQCLSGFIVHSISTGACSLAAVFAMHAYGRLEVLIQWIEHLVDGREDLCDNVDERLTIIVQQHVRILDFVSLTDKILREISVVEIAGCTLSMCFLGYYIIMEWETREMTSYVTNITLYISLTFNIFILCYIGELVSEKCKEIGEVSYMIDWHRLPGTRSLALVLMIAMSNTSVKLTAANLFELSISTFGNVVKTSIAYLNILRTLTT